jgi:hypothetical protein
MVGGTLGRRENHGDALRELLNRYGLANSAKCEPAHHDAPALQRPCGAQPDRVRDVENLELLADERIIVAQQRQAGDKSPR